MSWLTKYVRPKLRGLLKRDVPDNLWANCESCGQMLLIRNLNKQQKVCWHCGHHMKALAKERLRWTFDGGEYTPISLPKVPVDPLGFKDSKTYIARLKEARARTGLDDSLFIGTGTIGGQNAVVGVMAFEFMAGTMGSAMGEAFVAACRLAILQKSPLVIFTASGGARMQEGVVSLMQMPRTTIGVQMLREAGLPYITVLTHPTTGGVSASFAMLGDIQIAEPNALIAFAGPRVIKDTVREELPPGFQRSEYLLEHGMIDMIVKRRDMAKTLAEILSMLTRSDIPARVVPAPHDKPDGKKAEEAVKAGKSKQAEDGKAAEAAHGEDAARAADKPRRGLRKMKPSARKSAARSAAKNAKARQ